VALLFVVRMHDNSGEDGQQMAKLNLTNISNKSVRLEISSTHFLNPTSSMTHEKKIVRSIQAR